MLSSVLMEPHSFIFGQDDLRARSVEPFVVDREYSGLNLLYGGAEIVRQYAGLPREVPVPWATQPILNFRCAFLAVDDPPDDFDARAVEKARGANLPLYFAIAERRARVVEKAAGIEAYAIGSMFYYARELYRRDGLDAPVARRGTIALPDKSDLGRILDFDRERYAAKLAALPEEFQPVYVSMHWRDFERGCHEPYLRAGLRMVCSGHPYEPIFYQRLYDVCRRFKYSCSNEISTSFALSVLSGCHFFFLDGGPVTIVNPFQNTTYQGPEPGLEDPGRKGCIEASPFPPAEGGRARQRELVARATGEGSLRPPEFFRRMWEHGRETLSRRVTTAPLLMDRPPVPSEFATWLPAGFDGDGWADATCSLEVPARDGTIGVELELSFTLRDLQPGPPVLKMRLDGDPALESDVSIEGFTQSIFVASRADGARRRIEFFAPPAALLPGERRIRSFRLVKITWRTDPGPEPLAALPEAPPQGAPVLRKPGKWRAFIHRLRGGGGRGR